MRFNSSFNSKECLNSRGSEIVVSGAHGTKLCVHGGQERPVSEIFELCRESLRIHIANFSSRNISQQVSQTFDNLLECNKIPIYVPYNLYPKGTNVSYSIHRDTNAVLPWAVSPIPDSRIGLLTERNSNLILAEIGDIALSGLNNLERVSPVRSYEDRRSIVNKFLNKLELLKINQNY